MNLHIINKAYIFILCRYFCYICSVIRNAHVFKPEQMSYLIWSFQINTIYIYIVHIKYSGATVMHRWDSFFAYQTRIFYLFALIYHWLPAYLAVRNDPRLFASLRRTIDIQYWWACLAIYIYTTCIRMFHSHSSDGFHHSYECCLLLNAKGIRSIYHQQRRKNNGSDTKLL